MLISRQDSIFYQLEIIITVFHSAYCYYIVDPLAVLRSIISDVSRYDSDHWRLWFGWPPHCPGSPPRISVHVISCNSTVNSLRQHITLKMRLSSRQFKIFSAILGLVWLASCSCRKWGLWLPASNREWSCIRWGCSSINNTVDFHIKTQRTWFVSEIAEARCKWKM